jgi:hypothetical protein
MQEAGYHEAGKALVERTNDTAGGRNNVGMTARSETTSETHKPWAAHCTQLQHLKQSLSHRLHSTQTRFTNRLLLQTRTANMGLKSILFAASVMASTAIADGNIHIVNNCAKPLYLVASDAQVRTGVIELTKGLTFDFATSGTGGDYSDLHCARDADILTLICLSRRKHRLLDRSGILLESHGEAHSGLLGHCFSAPDLLQSCSRLRKPICRPVGVYHEHDPRLHQRQLSERGYVCLCGHCALHALGLLKPLVECTRLRWMDGG